ncbi:AAA family ATPase [Kitasatospora sp. NPDC003701]
MTVVPARREYGAEYRPADPPGEAEVPGLVARERSSADLADLLDRSCRGRGGFALVSGPAGSGKSALLRQVLGEARARGALVLEAAAWSFERDLDMGVMRQLFAHLVRSRSAEGVRCPTQDVSGAELAHRLWSDLRELAAERTVVIAVDDVQDADLASLHCLLYFARRADSARVTVVLTEGYHPHSSLGELRGELPRLRTFRSIELRALSPADVERLLAGRVGAERARQLVTECHAATGGNPALVRAVAADWEALDPGAAAPGLGAAYRRAAVGAVRRSWPGVLPVARALAVLGGSPAPASLARLAGVDERTVAQALRTLEAAGLTDGRGLRRAEARDALLDDMDPEERADLHCTAAQLLHEEGAEVTAVAEHLLEVGEGCGEMLLRLLEEVVVKALAAGRTELAAACLRQAAAVCPDPGRRARIVSKLALLEWRQDPEVAARHLPALIAAQDRGQLGGRHTAQLLRALLWHGRFEPVVEILGAARRADGGEPAPELRLARLWLAHSHPSMQGQLPPVELHDTTAPPIERASALLVAVLSGRGDEETCAAAERLLALSVGSDGEPEAALRALQVLVYLEQTPRARNWAARLTEVLPGVSGPVGRALVAELQAEIALRSGALGAAGSCARAALAALRPAAWGIGYTVPLAVLVRALTERGELLRAAELLELPLHPASLQTRFGLPYLHARGHHRLAGGHPREALGDFLTCGELMVAWGIDHPGLVPWRSSAAQACLALGDPSAAARYAAGQIARCADGPALRPRALALRLRAATLPAEQRLPLLREAAELLRDCGDRLEQARAVADLADAERATGHGDRAEAFRREALALAEECGAEPLVARLGAAEPVAGVVSGGAVSAPVGTAPVATAPAAQADADAQLSRAEQRVARLAAEGRYNREIALALNVTVSTVEQHLTSVYRKLHVKRRAQLAEVLDAPGHP